MRRLLDQYTIVAVALCVLAASGCSPSNEPTGPEQGSVQAYLDENPDVASRIDEDVEDEDEDDGTGD